MLWAGEVTAFLKLHVAGDLSAAPYVWGNSYGSLASYREYNYVYQRPYNTKWNQIASYVEQVLSKKLKKKF